MRLSSKREYFTKYIEYKEFGSIEITCELKLKSVVQLKRHRISEIELDAPSPNCLS